MEEDSDTDSGRAWSVDTEEEDEGVVRSPRINYLNFPEPEPEWDKDSFDGYEFYDPEDRKSFSDEEEYKVFRDFKIQAWKNRGFYEQDPFRSIFPLTDLEEPWIDMTTREYLESIASLCVKKLNEEKNKTVELVSIVRGNMKVGDGYGFWSKTSLSHPLPTSFSQILICDLHRFGMLVVVYEEDQDHNVLK
ncbi:Uncharacterized protein Rs2_11915 [Raphanus sativus]|nr:Uncharacterized protein Rs2_11915 [Raphanus sativus]